MEDQKKKVLTANQKKSVAGSGLAGLTVYAFSSGLLTSDMVVSQIQNLAHNQVVQAGFFYMAGQWLNNVMVRRSFAKFQGEVLESVNNLTIEMTGALDKLASALRADISAKADRQEMQDGFNRVHERIDSISQP